MKISRIEISNVLGLHRADIDVNSPVLMVIGANESGKSSLRDSISMAILGDPVRVKLKKNYGQLLHEDSKKGRVTLIQDGEVFAEYKLPGGEQVCESVGGKDFLPYVISPERAARLPEKEFRSMLFSLTRCKASPDATAKLLIERGCDESLVEVVKPLLRGGFPSTAKDAAERATQLKGSWRGITGENWGSDKAEGWTVSLDCLVSDRKGIEAAQAQMFEINAQIEKGTKFLGSLEQQKKDSSGLVERRQQLEELAGTLKRATLKKEATDKDLSTWEEKLITLGDQMKTARTGSVPVACPCCSENLRIVGVALEKFEGAVSDPKAAALLNGELIKAQDAVKLLRSTQSNDAKAIAAADDATTQLGLLQRSQGESVDQEKIDKTVQAITDLRLQRDQLSARVVMLTDQLTEIENAKSKESKAAKIHAECMAWLKIADALSPTGIPAELLAGAIQPVNDSLAILSRLSGWKKVEITPDMDITADGRLYGLMSESAKWRIDALLAIAIAQISELRFVVLDRFDVLDMVGRKQLFGMLIQLSEMGLMDQSIVCGTLKEPVKGMPAAISQVWINQGQAEQV